MDIFYPDKGFVVDYCSLQSLKTSGHICRYVVSTSLYTNSLFKKSGLWYNSIIQIIDKNTTTENTDTTIVYRFMLYLYSYIIIKSHRIATYRYIGLSIQFVVLLLMPSICADSTHIRYNCGICAPTTSATWFGI